MVRSPRLRRVLAGTGVGIVAALGVGGAVAATGESPQEESRALVQDVAERLGLAEDTVRTALEEAYTARVDEAVKDGRLTAAEGAEMKERIASGEVPLLGSRGVHRHGPAAHVVGPAAAAGYLGLTEAELHAQLESGTTLAEVAEARGTSVEGLTRALTDAAAERVREAVAAGRLTEAQEQTILADLRERIEDLVDGRMHRAWPFRPQDGMAPPPDDPARPGMAPAALPAYPA